MTLKACDTCDRYVHDYDDTQLFAVYPLSPLPQRIVSNHFKQHETCLAVLGERPRDCEAVMAAALSAQSGRSRLFYPISFRHGPISTHAGMGMGRGTRAVKKGS